MHCTCCNVLVSQEKKLEEEDILLPTCTHTSSHEGEKGCRVGTLVIYNYIFLQTGGLTYPLLCSYRYTI